jgi:hypothetical protein
MQSKQGIQGQESDLESWGDMGGKGDQGVWVNVGSIFCQNA